MASYPSARSRSLSARRALHVEVPLVRQPANDREPPQKRLEPMGRRGRDIPCHGTAPRVEVVDVALGCSQANPRAAEAAQLLDTLENCPDLVWGRRLRQHLADRLAGQQDPSLAVGEMHVVVEFPASGQQEWRRGEGDPQEELGRWERPAGGLPSNRPQHYNRVRACSSPRRATSDLGFTRRAFSYWAAASSQRDSSANRAPSPR